MPDQAINESESTYALLSNVTKTSNALTPPWYYQFLIKLLKPLYRITLWRRHKKAKKSGIETADYKEEIAARFGRHYPDVPTLASDKISGNRCDIMNNATIWCHAVSLGETNTIAPMLKVMLEQGTKIWITNTTQTGFARTEVLFKEALESRQMVHTFVPVDDKAVVKKFIDHVNPDLAMFVETELWANILAELCRSGIPSVLVNARLSQKSFESYAKYERVSTSMMQNITMIIAQDADSAKRFRRLGTPVPKIRRADSLKWSTGNANTQTQTASERSVLVDRFAHSAQALERPIWVAGSTHEGEEAQVLQVHQQLLQQAGMANALLILVPRHPERFDEVAEAIEAIGLNFYRRSNDEKIDADTQVYLADTMGELNACYAIADVAFVGGSLVNIGGHNPIEAASLAKPIIMGPYTQSCHELVEVLHQQGALEVVEASETNKKRKTADDKSTASLLHTLQYWLTHSDQAKQAGQKAKELVTQKSDAMTHQLDMIEALLTEHKEPKVDASLEIEQIDLEHFKVRARTDI